MLRKVQWSGFPIIANLFRGRLLHCEGASSRGGCRAQRAPSRAHHAQAVVVAAFPRAWLQAASTHMQRPLCHVTEGRRKDWVSLSPCSSVLALGTQTAHRSWARSGHGNIRSALGLGPTRGFVRMGCFLLISVTWTCSSAVSNIQGPKRSQSESAYHTPLSHMLGCAQPLRQMRKCGHQQLCALAGRL